MLGCELWNRLFHEGSAMRGSIFIDYINGIFNVNRGEWPKISFLSIYSALAVSVLVIVQSVINALFLESYDTEYLPYLFASQALFYIIVSTIHSSLIERLNRKDESYFLLGLLLVSLLVSRFFLSYEIWWFVFFLYVLLQTLVDILIVHSATNVSATLDVRAGKRLAPVIDAGGTLGAVVGGVAVTVSVSYIGSENLLFICIPLIVLKLLVSKAIFRRYLQKGRRVVKAESVGEYSYLKGVKELFSDLGRERLMVTFSILFAAMIMASTIVDFQFKTMLKRTYSRDEIAAFLGLFYALINTVAIFVQLFFSSRILLSMGLIFTIGLLPASLFFGSTLFILLPFMFIIAGVRFFESVLKFSLHKAASTLVFMPFPPIKRDKLRIATGGILKPIAIIASSSILIVLGRYMDVRFISFFVLIACLVALKSVLRMKSSYVNKLNESLSNRRIRLEKKAILTGGHDRQIIETIEDGLSLVEKSYVLFSLEIVRNYKIPVESKRIEALFDNPDEEIRREALLTVRELGKPEFSGALLNYLKKTKNKSELAECIRTLRHLGSKEIIEDIEPYLSDDDGEVRGEALLYMIKSGNREAKDRAEGILGELSLSEESSDLRLAAYVVGESGYDKYIPLLKSLIENSDSGVKKEAALAAGKTISGEMLPYLVSLLEVKEINRTARNAIAAYGDACLPFLKSLLYSEETTSFMKREILLLMGSIASHEAVEILTSFLLEGDDAFSDYAIASIKRLGRSIPVMHYKYSERFKKTIEREVNKSYRAYYLIHLLAGEAEKGDGPFNERKPLLLSEVRMKIKELRRRIFSILEFIYGEKTIYKAYLNYISGVGRNRANSLELLDNMLDTELARLIIPLFEEMSLERRLKIADDRLTGAPVGRNTLLNGADFLGDRWIKSVIYWSLDKKDDEISHWEGVMLQMMERIFFLKSVPLFSQLSGEELKPMAEMYREVSFKKDTVIFRENDSSDNFYLIVDGEVRVEKGGKEIALLAKGDYFGEMALLDHEPRSATIIATADSDFLQLGREDFYEIIDEYPTISRGIIMTLSKRLRKTLEMKSA